MLRRNRSREAVKPRGREVSLRVRQPASRTCPPFGSCPGRRRRAVCSGGDPYPAGQTGAVRSGSSGRSLPWGNPATRDDQTHSLQHTERRRFTTCSTGPAKEFYGQFQFSSAVRGTGRLRTGARKASCKVETKWRKDDSIRLRCGLAATPAEVNKLKATELKFGTTTASQPPRHPATLNPRSRRNTNSTTPVEALCK